MVKDKKYCTLMAIRSANEKLRKFATFDEIKETYNDADDRYLSFLAVEKSITYGIENSKQAYTLLPKGEDYIIDYEKSEFNRKVALVTMRAAVAGLIVGALTLVLSLTMWLVQMLLR